MRFKEFIGLLAMAMVACETPVFGHQKAIASALKPRSVQQQATQAEFITPQELKTILEKSEPVVIVDVRSSSFYAQSDRRIKGAIHSKARKVVHRLRNVPPDREIITYCSCPADESAVVAARELLAKGFKRVRVLKGGWNGWLQAGGQMEQKPRF
jgi:rhodanese-related sulfurtransferase